MSVGSNIKLARKRMRLSQGELGKKVNLSASQISNIESGKKQTTFEKIVEIAEALECNVADLYDKEDKMQEENAWIIFGEEMKKEGIEPEQAKKWIKLAKKILDEKD